MCFDKTIITILKHSILLQNSYSVTSRLFCYVKAADRPADEDNNDMIMIEDDENDNEDEDDNNDTDIDILLPSFIW